MKHFPYTRHKYGIYSIISAFILIVVILFVTIGLAFIISSMSLFKANLMDKYSSDIKALDIKNMVSHCFGGIINESGAYDEACLQDTLGQVKGITVSTLRYGSCIPKNITIMPPEGYSTSEIFYVPVYQDNQKIICPGRLHIYT